MHIGWFAGHRVAEYTPSPRSSRGAKFSSSAARSAINGSPTSPRTTAGDLPGVAQAQSAHEHRAVLGDDAPAAPRGARRPSRRGSRRASACSSGGRPGSGLDLGQDGGEKGGNIGHGTLGGGGIVEQLGEVGEGGGRAGEVLQRDGAVEGDGELHRRPGRCRRGRRRSRGGRSAPAGMSSTLANAAATRRSVGVRGGSAAGASAGRRVGGPGGPAPSCRSSRWPVSGSVSCQVQTAGSM